ncbi:hypothetical protein [Dyadobacter sp. 3J3]|uniref:hypothetical protein n=1 Tax=Dyadobacter sp. 3J3 TaxID=2606600 RepID=UPI001358692D|nr:hypothetical protein [Dyadobacter sp. 3J3]
MSIFIRLDTVTVNLRHGDLAGAFLELLNVIFGAHWHEYQNHQQSLSMPPRLKWFANLMLSSLVSLTMLTTIV